MPGEYRPSRHEDADQRQQQPEHGQKHWGKRLREADNDVRFSELSPAQRMQRRRQEREEKKERDRTLSYFRSAQRTMDQHGRTGDPIVLASIVDGFFGELFKLLKADPTFHLLRNGVVCRAVEAALGSASLLQSKTLLYVFIGHVPDLMVSPVASYTLETLMVSLSLSLSTLAESNAEGFTQEMLESGPGLHTGSGVPSTATVLRSMVDELVGVAEDLLVHEVGARALRSMILVLGGHMVRNAPPPAYPVRHTALLGSLATALVAALEEAYGREYQTSSAAESWLAAAQVPATSFVVQSFLRVAKVGSPAWVAVTQHMEQLTHRGKPLLWHLMTDRHLGTHLFQAYSRAPAPAPVRELGDALGVKIGGRLRASAQPPTVAKSTGQRRGRAAAERLAALARAGEEDNGTASHGPREPYSGSARVLSEAEGADLLDCSWGRAMCMVRESFSQLLSERQMPFLVQDLVLGTPTAAHLCILWEQLLGPRLDDMVGGDAAATTALAALARKCAFTGAVHREDPRADPSGSAAADSSADEVPDDLNALLRADESNGVRYFAVPVELQRLVCEQLCSAAAAHDTKGEAAHYYLASGELNDRRLDIARCLLYCHPSATKQLQHSIGALSAADLLASACSHKGSVVLQRYLRTASYWTAGSSTSAAAEGGEAAMGLLRKLDDRLHELVHSKYGAFVVETLYEVGSVPVKEALVDALMPIYDALRTQPDGETGGEVAMQRHVARKVTTKCCVEQYVHRRDDWQKLAQRQVQVQRLLWRMQLEG